jgi:hypothetical protein
MADSRGMKRPSTASTTHSQEKRPRQGTFDGAWNSRDSGLLVTSRRPFNLILCANIATGR